MSKGGRGRFSKIVEREAGVIFMIPEQKCPGLNPLEVIDIRDFLKITKDYFVPSKSSVLSEI